MAVASTPWRDRKGAFSPLKATVLALLAAPALVPLTAFALGALGAEPVERLQDEFGRWAVRCLLLSLAVTPLRLLWRWNRLILVRRMLGLAALGYALGHLAAYAALEDWVLAKMASEIAARIYLAIGAVALAGMIALGLTSTDGAVRRLGATRWQALHRASYAIAVLAVTHVFLQTRLDPSEAFVLAGVLAWLLAVRAWRAWAGSLAPTAALGLAVAATAAAALAEAVFFHLKFGAPLATLLAANLDAATGARPAWWVAGLTLPVAIGAFARLRLAPTPRPRRASA
ncbi:MAG: sulfite oxidase heme-binding subunit YedZ [Alphaproteobacteria bacterium]